MARGTGLLEQGGELRRRDVLKTGAALAAASVAGRALGAASETSTATAAATSPTTAGQTARTGGNPAGRPYFDGWKSGIGTAAGYIHNARRGSY